MKIKEAIEFCEEIKEYFNNDKGNQIIALLQQGEKYKQMWFELYGIASEFNFFPMMDKLEQKYFPKE